MADTSTASAIPADERTVQLRIARMIKAFMAAHDENQGDLARLLHREQPQVSKMLSGQRRMTVDELAVLAAHYGRHPGFFFDDFEDLVGQNLKKLNGADLRLIAGGNPDTTAPGPGQLTIPFRPLRLVES